MIELIWRGRTHWTMLIAGGVCFVIFSVISERCKKRTCIFKAVSCALSVTLVELIFGIVFNLVFKMNVWDYSNQPGNVLGQICPAFGLLWFFIMPLAIWAEDTARWLIWAYDSTVYGRGGKPPDTPYSLKSVYGDFFHGR